MERSLNKDYKYKKMISPNLENINSNNISLNDLVIHKQYNINNNNKSIDLQIYDYIKKNSADNEKDINKKLKYQNISKIINNKSMDSKRLLNNNINSNIIHINNGKIINLSNLSNITYGTAKYDCYYENKRDKRTPKSNANVMKKNIKNKNINIKTNTSNYINNRKGTITEDYINTNKNLNKSGNINPILFTRK